MPKMRGLFVSDMTTKTTSTSEMKTRKPSMIRDEHEEAVHDVPAALEVRVLADQETLRQHLRRAHRPRLPSHTDTTV